MTPRTWTGTTPARTAPPPLPLVAVLVFCRARIESRLVCCWARPNLPGVERLSRTTVACIGPLAPAAVVTLVDGPDVPERDNNLSDLAPGVPV